MSSTPVPYNGAQHLLACPLVPMQATNPRPWFPDFSYGVLAFYAYPHATGNKSSLYGGLAVAVPLELKGLEVRGLRARPLTGKPSPVVREPCGHAHLVLKRPCGHLHKRTDSLLAEPSTH